MNNNTFSAGNPADYLDSIAVFGEINKNILTDNFRGGNASNIFGSTKLDFTHASLTGVSVVDVSQVFGDIKITVPHDWRVEVDLTHFFSTVNDRRAAKTASTTGTKMLVLKGVSVFGNVDILSSGF